MKQNVLVLPGGENGGQWADKSCKYTFIFLVKSGGMAKQSWGKSSERRDVFSLCPQPSEAMRSDYPRNNVLDT